RIEYGFSSNQKSSPSENSLARKNGYYRPSRKLMRTVEIKDRLRLRLTCRAFEKIVANTHAGYCDLGGII
ncbi:hypothetical protein PENTCL1PPCAC_863, partial [Pristionchus entomophagus]